MYKATQVSISLPCMYMHVVKVCGYKLVLHDMDFSSNVYGIAYLVQIYHTNYALSTMMIGIQSCMYISIHERC